MVIVVLIFEYWVFLILKYLKIYCRPLFIKIWAFLKDWRNAVSFILAWLITNGWGWFFLIAGPILRLRWMTKVGGAYIAFLWMPMVNEKVVTIALAALIKKLIWRRRRMHV